MKQQMTLFVQALDINKTNKNPTLCLDSGYNQNKQQSSLFVQTLDITKTCLLWLYPEPEQRVGFIVCCGYIQSEQRVGFVVCFGYIKSLNEE
jgi:hypothetical protein